MALTPTPLLLGTASVANGADTSEWIDVRDVLAGAYIVPGTYTNTGATNLQYFDVSNTYGDPSGTAVNDILPNTSDTVQSQRQSTSTLYPFLPDLFKFRFIRFNGHTTEGGARVINYTLRKGYVRWSRNVVEIAASGTTSGALDIRGAIGGSFQTPSALTGTAITFSVSMDGGTYTVLNTTADADISQTVGTSSLYPFPDGVFAFNYVKLISGSSEAAIRRIVCDLKFRG